MREGWAGDDYLIVFDAVEVAGATEAYGLPRFLPGYQIVALVGWDDFLVVDGGGRRFRVPTVPLDTRYLEADGRSFEDVQLAADDSFKGRIKWYLQPLCFGGDPRRGPNMTWVDFATHQQLVRFWNERYRRVAQGNGG
ncbi:MAG: hypothetical protein HY905_03805 [Deltaproteobacteria bacterium]|nr:hypothetical protein [Deltaproteobacteria bacterium]